MQRNATLDVVPGLGAPHTARAFTRETLAAWEVRSPDVEAVQLVVSELVTNALTHAPESRAITLQLLGDDACVQVRVSDEGRNAPERRSVSDPESGIENGRGIWIVDAFTDHWGTESGEHGGKTVWCEVPTERMSKR
jgi:anti-sigma regulatory factor (Ser/Thr protein kinase)